MPSISSSAMHRVEYDEVSRNLDIWFNGTGRYTYYRVPASVYAGLLAASSKGAYFNDHIRERYG